jgi:5'-3' exonuclease
MPPRVGREQLFEERKAKMRLVRAKFANETPEQRFIRMQAMAQKTVGKMKCDTIIVDGSHAAHRISAATPPLNNSKGQRTEVIYGLLRLLSSVMRQNPSTRCYVVWDGPGCKQIRRDVYPSYKVHRDDKDVATKERIKSMHEQVDRFWEQFGQYLPIHWVVSSKYEADDLIAMLANRSAREGDKVLIVSGDGDLLQLVTRQIVVYSPFKDRYCDLDNFKEFTKGFPTPQAWLYAKCLMGDSSDNIKGIGGVAEVTALKILQSVNWENRATPVWPRTQPGGQTGSEAEGPCHLADYRQQLQADVPQCQTSPHLCGWQQD